MMAITKPKLLLHGALLSILPSIATSHPCPPGAEVANPAIVVAATRANGELLTHHSAVEPGDTIVVRMAAIFLLDTLRPIAAFQGGTFTLTITGNTTDVTPPQGIPIVGPESCGGVPAVISANLQYTVHNSDLAAGTLRIQADYTGGIAHFESDWPVESSTVATLPVVSRLKIRMLSPGAVLLQFVGVPGRTYHIQATTDLKQWAEIGTVVPDPSGECRFEHASARPPYGFYRYMEASVPIK